MTNIYVEYTDHIAKVNHSEILTWSAFCDMSMEQHIEITFCCITDDPRINVD